MPLIKKQSLLSLTSESDKPNIFEVCKEREWFFAFCQNEVEIPKWQQFFVRNDPENLQHVYAFTQAGPNVLFVEPYRDRIDFTIKYPTPDFEHMWAEKIAQELMSFGHTVVKHKFIPNINSVKSLWNWIPTCVTVVKVATGYPSSAWTPRQLLEELLANGATLPQRIRS